MTKAKQVRKANVAQSQPFTAVQAQANSKRIATKTAQAARKAAKAKPVIVKADAAPEAAPQPLTKPQVAMVQQLTAAQTAKADMLAGVKNYLLSKVALGHRSAQEKLRQSLYAMQRPEPDIVTALKAAQDAVENIAAIVALQGSIASMRDVIYTQKID